MEMIGRWIAEIVKEVKEFKLPEDKEERKEHLKEFKEKIKNNEKILETRKEVIELCKKFPLYPDMDILK